MPFAHHTPESLLNRSDSKDPATTCKGITSTGRPCRRALAASHSNSPVRFSNHNVNGVLAVLDAGEAAAFFCWQHQSQAQILVDQLRDRSQVLPLKQRSSIDTLIERVGILDLDDDDEGKQHMRAERDDGEKIRRHTGSRKRNALPQQWQQIQGPLMSVPEEVVEAEGYSRPRPHRATYRRQTRAPVRQSNVKASWSCCVWANDEEELPAVRKRDRDNRRRPQSSGRPWPSLQPVKSHESHLKRDKQVRRKPAAPLSEMQGPSDTTFLQEQIHPAVQVPYTPVRPRMQSHASSVSPPNSQTVSYLSLIPLHLSPVTTSAILAELSRPISESDQDGYIYIFWLTPESEATKPDDDTASSLLDLDYTRISSSPGQRPRRQSEIHRQEILTGRVTNALERYASLRRTPAEPRKILLKIGRASNVHRRLSQWERQCGQNITLIRYYPYQSNRSDDQPVPSSPPKKTVPHVHRVERLIHLELADKRVTDKPECEACGRTHREWFAVDASKEGVRYVDEVIRRWVGWAEKYDPTP